METGGYDVVAEINETLLNNFLKLGYCMGKFPVFSGVYTLPIDDVPESLEEFLDIGYEVSIAEEPSIDFTSAHNIVMNARGQCKFTVLGGIEFELEVEFTVRISPTFNQSTRQFKVDFVEASIDDVELNDTFHLSHNVITKLNEILAIAMGEYLTEDITSIQLSPVIFSTDLPMMPPGDANKLTIGMGNIKVLSSKVVASAVNLLGYTGGNINAVTDFTSGNHIGVGVNEGAMHRVYDFWWQRTTWPKNVTKTGSHDFDPPDFVDFVDELVDWVAAVLTLGIVDVDVDIDRVWANYGATLGFSKFEFDLKPGNKVEISGSVTANIYLRVYVQITTTTELFWGLVDVDEDTSTVKLFDLSINGLQVDIETAEGMVYLDDDNQLVVDVTELDLNIPLNWDIPEFLLNYIVDWVVDMIVDNLPPIVLFPAMITQTIPDSTVTVEATFNKLEIDEPEALIAANIETSGMESYAPYMANMNLDSMEVHKRDCEWAHRTAYRNRKYYCNLEEALASGFDGCAYCLPEYHTR
jgi:hypothetical protein